MLGHTPTIWKTPPAFLFFLLTCVPSSLPIAPALNGQGGGWRLFRHPGGASREKKTFVYLLLAAATSAVGTVELFVVVDGWLFRYY